MDFGKAIMLIRKQVGLKQYELAEACGISQTSLSLIETGTKRPSERTIKKICTACDIPDSVLYILCMQDTDIPENKKEIYGLVYPSIRNLALQMIDARDKKIITDAELSKD